MSLEKQVVVDKIEVTEDGTVQVRETTRIVEDGKVISQSYHRHTIAPGQDYSNDDARVQAIAQAAWTPEVIAAYAAQQAANQLGA
jgi:hypothetical protein